jgi:hypothetical protein
MTRRRYAVAGAVLVTLIAVLGFACGRDRAPPRKVPVSWQDVRTSAGHTVHVQQHAVPCRDCHGDAGFAPPPAEVC